MRGSPVTAPRPSASDIAAAARVLAFLTERSCSWSIEVNEHRNYYEPPPEGVPEPVVRLQVYGHTPVGSDTYGGPDFFGALMGALKDADTREPWRPIGTGGGR